MIHESLKDFYLLQENLTFLILVFSPSTLYILFHKVEFLPKLSTCLPTVDHEAEGCIYVLRSLFCQLDFDIICFVLSV